MEEDFGLFNFFHGLVEVCVKAAVNVCMTGTISLGEDLAMGPDQLWWLSVLQGKSPCRAAHSALRFGITHLLPELWR